MLVALCRKQAVGALASFEACQPQWSLQWGIVKVTGGSVTRNWTGEGGGMDRGSNFSLPKVAKSDLTCSSETKSIS